MEASRLSGMVFGLEMIYRMGQDMLEPDEQGRHTAASLIGLAIMGAGWMGWVAGHALQAAVAHWLDSHPTLEQRIRRIYGRPLGPLPLQGQQDAGGAAPFGAGS